MKEYIYQVHDFPKEGYTRDDRLQSKLTARSKAVDRLMKRLFFGFIVAFLSSIVLILWVHPLFVFVGIAGGAALALAALMLLPPPKPLCSECGKKMKKQYELIHAESKQCGEFLVCDACRRYAYTHRVSRP